MSPPKIQELKNAIDRLSILERCELLGMLAPTHYEEWRKQILELTAAGKIGR